MADWKSQLVNSVKTWQKMSASHKESWYRFVQERTGQAHFDPNRHDEATLNEFIQMAEGGQIELRPPEGIGSSGRNMGKGGGAWDGGGGDWWSSKGGGKGGGKAFDMSAGKQELVDQVKTWQRLSASHKEAWYHYVQETTWDTNFDPNRHSEATLRDFIQKAEAGQINLTSPTGFGSSGGKKGGKGGGGDDWGSMHSAVAKVVMGMMGGKGKGGKGGKGWSPY
eukprot:TRINITY_DN280_c0_g1_i1.p1 TRINITY_DN280_c0_g1~~TRINITY_DN280_c0_g1_i1.p1  ORF type:complete len:223 (+),score=45.55 TRINITY_DN280_c0_g1_i1:58-726(+)